MKEQGEGKGVDPGDDPKPVDHFQEKLDRWKEEWNRELDEDLAAGR